MSHPTSVFSPERGMISIRGAREHNLKDVDLDLPRGQFIVFSGVSGSGKSSLAFDTLFAEGQRRYVESLSAYARQFLGQMEKPRVTSLKGLSPTIAIEQKTALRNPRSTVGTITEILDYLRVLYARAGTQRCHRCHALVVRTSAAEIVAEILLLPVGTRFQLLAPVARRIQDDIHPLFERLRQGGFSRVRIDGDLYRMEDLPALDRRKSHDIDLVVDRLVVQDDVRSRLTDSVETCLRHGEGFLVLDVVGQAERTFCEKLACAQCGVPVPELSPQLFSFNHPLGMCPECNGLGTRMEPDLSLMIPNPEKSPLEGAVVVLGDVSKEQSYTGRMLAAVGEEFGFAMDRPWREIKAEHQHLILYGTGERKVTFAMNEERGEGTFSQPWEGVIPTLLRRLKETRSEDQRTRYLQYLSTAECGSCKGGRLRPEATAVSLTDQAGQPTSLPDLLNLPLTAVRTLLDTWQPGGARAQISRDLRRELGSRLSFLIDVGVGYLTLSRPGPSLSGGEAQRIRLASQLGSELTGVLYVLDEPSIGLHPRDTGRLLATLTRLRDGGNTVLVVEHDEATLKIADFVVDFGPGAGRSGGEVLYAGDLPGLLQCERSLTGAYLAGRMEITLPRERRRGSGQVLEIQGAHLHNLKHVNVSFPLGTLIAVTGVSGAGKSSLIRGIVAPLLAHHLNGAREKANHFNHVAGLQYLDKVIEVDQSPIGRSPRSNPATYTGAFDLIRTLFAESKEARLRGFGPERFSFNAKGGRCEVCLGEGAKKVEMHFLADVFVTCDVCGGRRFNEATLEIQFKGHSIADVLEMPIVEAYALFRNFPRLGDILDCLRQVGLGYLCLGQSATTLSGGEAQRLKLAKELSRPQTGRTFYILDEPTTGLHPDDIRKLLEILQSLVERGNTVLVVEHEIHLIKAADHVIDLGPEGGGAGGYIVACGTPEEVARVPSSFTGQILREVLAR